MRRALTIALVGWFAVAVIVLQSCAGPGHLGSPYRSVRPTGSARHVVSNFSGPPSSAPVAVPLSTYIDTTGYTADKAGSEALTAYLKHHRLPLVGAQVLSSLDGDRAVVLYGYEGSDFGKQDATIQTQLYLADSKVAIDNRIKVKPELLAAGSKGQTNWGNSAYGSGGPGSADQAAAGSPDSQLPGISSYLQQQNQAQQYVQQQNMGSAVSSVTPLLMLGLMALSMSSGGSSLAVGPGSFRTSPFGPYGTSPFGITGRSRFGPVPYNPYSGFPSLPVVTPYGGAASPYTAAPRAPFGP